jgi:hypothetical protein
MITSNQIITLSEEWVKSVITPGDEKCDVYENPGSTDIKELYQLGNNLIRYVADAKSQRVYVWSAMLALHDTVRVSLGLGHSGPNAYKDTPYVIEGFGQISGSKIVTVFRKHEGTLYHREEALQALLDWERFIPLDPDNVKEKLRLREYTLSTLSAILNYNWSFVDKYIVGDGARLKKLQTDYQGFLTRMKKYGYS